MNAKLKERCNALTTRSLSEEATKEKRGREMEDNRARRAFLGKWQTTTGKCRRIWRVKRATPLIGTQHGMANGRKRGQKSYHSKKQTAGNRWKEE